MKNRNFRVFLFWAVILGFAGIFLICIPKSFNRHNERDERIIRARTMLSSMQFYLKRYYENRSSSVVDIQNSDIVNFIISINSHKFSTKPGVPLNKYVGVYFCLPRELKGDIAEIIAYTTPVKADDGTIYRVALILYENEMTAILLDSTLLETIFHIRKTERHPDIYFWK